MSIKINFVIGQISDGDFELLETAHKVTTKMILPIQDLEVFHYRVGDRIQVETQTGNRLWCKILELETIREEERVLMIFTLISEAA